MAKVQGPRTPEQRKAASIALLRERGIPVLESLPVIEGEDEAGSRSEDELRGQLLANSTVWLRAQFAATGRSHQDFLRAFEPLRTDGRYRNVTAQANLRRPG